MLQFGLPFLRIAVEATDLRKTLVTRQLGVALFCRRVGELNKSI